MKNTIDIRVGKKWCAFFVIMLISILSVYRGALADVGGYAQTGVDRFTHTYESKLTGDVSKDIVTIALAQVGRDGYSLGYFYGDWCAAFVTDCAKYAGVDNLIPFVSGHTHACGGDNSTYGYLYEYVLRAGAVAVDISQAKSGDLVFFGNTSSSNFSHVGLVTGSNATVEGNVNGNHYSTRVVGTSTIYGRGYSRISVLRPQYPAPKGTLDVKGCLNGTLSDTLGTFGAFDITIAGNKYSKVNDYRASHTPGTSYSITNIEAKSGYDYLGVKTGSLSGQLPAGVSTVVLNFATQGHLYVEGNLDGIRDSSIENYGSFDVYINGELDASDCISYNKKWPKGTTYEVRNIKAAAGKNYTGLTSFTGTIVSNTESKVTLSLTTDGIATADWQIGKVIPGNLNLETLDIEYKHHYEKVSATSPGTGWVQAGVSRTYYQNSGSVEEYPYEKATSDAYVYVGGYYYHWCGSNNDCNYQKTPGKYETYHGPNSLDAFDVVKTGDDTNNAQVKWYSLKWKPGQPYSGAATCASNQTASWYRIFQYQPRALITEYRWTKDADWTSVYDASCTSYSVRWRLKDGVPAEYKGLQLHFVVDGESVASLDGVAKLDVYINGEKKAENATSFRNFYPGDFAYEIQLTDIADDKLYKKIEGGDLFGTVNEDLKTLTLYFDTGVQAGENWKEIPYELLPYIDEHTDVEYRHTYTQTGRTSPGEGWTMIQQGAVQYENSGAPYESDNELTTSATRALVGYYYFHWCNYGEVANYYQKDYLPVRHAISMDLMSHFSAKEMGTDGDGSGRKYYYLTHLDGEYAGGTAKCSTNGAVVYYRGAVYQDKVAYRINTYQKVGDWTSELDTSAASVEYRIRLKQYPVMFETFGGVFDATEMTKYSGKDLILPAEVPTRDMYEFVAWNTAPDGTGTAYLPGSVYSNDQAVTLYAYWKEVHTLSLPESLSIIEEEAFSGITAQFIFVPSSCVEIHSRAFANCSNLQRIYLSGATESIALDAFEGCTKVTVYAPAGSTAIKVAKYNDIPYVETETP